MHLYTLKIILLPWRSQESIGHFVTMSVCVSVCVCVCSRHTGHSCGPNWLKFGRKTREDHPEAPPTFGGHRLKGQGHGHQNTKTNKSAITLAVLITGGCDLVYRNPCEKDVYMKSER